MTISKDSNLDANWRIRLLEESGSVLFINSYEKKTVLYTGDDLAIGLARGRHQTQGAVPFGILLTARAIQNMKQQHRPEADVARPVRQDGLALAA